MTKLVLWVAALTACATTESTGITADDLTCPTDSTLTYASFGEDFLATHCLSCHASKQRPSLSTQAEVRANSPDILQQAVYTAAMPADGSLSTDERRLLGEWLTCGAP